MNGVDRGVDGTVAADHENRRVVAPRSKHLDNGDAVETGHAQVEQDEVERIRLEKVDRRRTVGRLDHFVAVLSEQRGSGEPERAIVVDEQES